MNTLSVSCKNIKATGNPYTSDIILERTKQGRDN